MCLHTVCTWPCGHSTDEWEYCDKASLSALPSVADDIPCYATRFKAVDPGPDDLCPEACLPAFWRCCQCTAEERMAIMNLSSLCVQSGCGHVKCGDCEEWHDCACGCKSEDCTVLLVGRRRRMCAVCAAGTCGGKRNKALDKCLETVDRKLSKGK